MSRANLTSRSSPAPQRIAFPVDDSTDLVADFYAGTGPESILVLPGFWRSRRHPLMAGIAASLHQTGSSVCILDLRGHGESGGTFGFNTREAADCVAVLDSLRTAGVFEGSTCVLGFSAGGSIALSCAHMRQDLVRGVVLVSPVADFKRVLPRPSLFGLHRQLSLYSAMRPPRFWWYETERRNTLRDASTVTAPICLIHARNDWLVHHSHAERIAASLPLPPEVHILDLRRAHGERVFDSDLAPWNLMTSFMENMLGMNLSGA